MRRGGPGEASEGGAARATTEGGWGTRRHTMLPQPSASYGTRLTVDFRPDDSRRRTAAATAPGRGSSRPAAVRLPVPRDFEPGREQGHAGRAVPRALPRRPAPVRRHRDRVLVGAVVSVYLRLGRRSGLPRAAGGQPVAARRGQPHVLVAGTGGGPLRPARRGHLHLGGRPRRARAGPGLDARQLRRHDAWRQARVRPHRQRRHCRLDCRRLVDAGVGPACRHREHAGRRRRGAGGLGGARAADLA